MDKKINQSLEIISEAIKKYPKIAVACSFGKDSIVTVHLCRRIKPDIQIFTIMTPFKFKETFAYKDYITALWQLNIKDYGWKDIAPDTPVNFYRKDPDKCCDIYKVEPTKWAIKELKLDAWITGLRQTEGGEMREKFTKEVEFKEDGLVKINPILHWTEADIWRYHAINSIPVHPLYSQGYRSLGCQPCSLPNTEEERGGRWANTCKAGGECGIHTQLLKS